jgi:hypothetical protein
MHFSKSGRRSGATHSVVRYGVLQLKNTGRPACPRSLHFT